jgi:hypothetical protein
LKYKVVDAAVNEDDNSFLLSKFFLSIFWTNYDFLLDKKKIRRFAVWRDIMAVQMKIFGNP